MPKAGRPSKYTPEIAALICARLAEGESLRSICGGLNLACGTVLGWALDDVNGFQAQYMRARELQADFHGDKVLAVLETEPDQIVTTRPDGTTETKRDPAHVAWLKNQADGLKWHAGQMRPKVWGNKVQVDAEMKVDVGSALDAARKRARGAQDA
ncbi:hypothetical protein [Acidocella sp. KAb 2-4]|uniref:terminase small subunit-like protein n=1 Tax=Acidocella sp. KAb 2-4 TaxID=2885158 RepID=UPI00351CD0FA